MRLKAVQSFPSHETSFGVSAWVTALEDAVLKSAECES